MVTRSEVQVQEKRKQAKPDMDLLHHLVCVRPSQEASVTVKLNDGTAYDNVPLEHIFTDGFTIFTDKHRIYLPLTAVSNILMHNPTDDK
jgi:hypothetical protein